MRSEERSCMMITRKEMKETLHHKEKFQRIPGLQKTHTANIYSEACVGKTEQVLAHSTQSDTEEKKKKKSIFEIYELISGTSDPHSDPI